MLQLQARLRAALARHAQAPVQARGEARRDARARTSRPCSIKEIDEEMTPAEFRANELGMKVLGLLPREINLKETMVKVYSEEIAAFYDTKTKTMHLIKEPEAKTKKPPTLPRAPPGQDGGIRQGREQDGDRARADPRPGRPELRPRRDAEGRRSRTTTRPRPLGPDRGRGDPDDDRRRDGRLGRHRRSATCPPRGSTGSSAC